MDLSAEGEKLLEICNSAAEAVSESIKKMVGDPTSGTVMHMGADGTPTKTLTGGQRRRLSEFLRGRRSVSRSYLRRWAEE